MNVIYDHQAFTLQQYGGISRYFFELISRMCLYPGIDVSFFPGFHVSEYPLGRLRSRCTNYFGYGIPMMSHTLMVRLAMNEWLLRRATRSIREGIYHETYFYDVLPSWKGKRVVTVYDMIYERFPGDYDRDDPTARNKASAVRKADLVICISEGTRQDVIDILHVSPGKTVVVHLANSLKPTVQTESIFPGPYLLFVGKRGGYKNFARALNAFARTPSLRTGFRFVCFGGGGFTSQERDRIRFLGVSDRVSHVMGSDEMLASLYGHASALVYPSLYEGFGIPLLEAMCFGCPLAVSNVGSMPEVVGDAGVFFDPLSEEDIASAVQRIVDDPVLCSTLVQRGRRREKEFSWDTCALQTLEAYKLFS